jgi:hypothetical protein
MYLNAFLRLGFRSDAASRFKLKAGDGRLKSSYATFSFLRRINFKSQGGRQRPNILVTIGAAKMLLGEQPGGSGPMWSRLA